MLIITAIVLVFSLVLASWLYALARRRHVRTTIKGPWSFSVELEADDGDYQPRRQNR